MKKLLVLFIVLGLSTASFGAIVGFHASQETGLTAGQVVTITLTPDGAASAVKLWGISDGGAGGTASNASVHSALIIGQVAGPGENSNGEIYLANPVAPVNSFQGTGPGTSVAAGDAIISFDYAYPGGTVVIDDIALVDADPTGFPTSINYVTIGGVKNDQNVITGVTLTSGVIPTVYFVDTNASGANNGTNWLNAFNHLQDGLAAADYGDMILVAEGTYRPDEDTADPGGTGVRTDTFALISGVAIYGGFPTGGSDFADRNPNQHETILSGDLRENDAPDFANNDENSYHVVTGSGTDATAVLDGFTISGGNANTLGYPHRDGGGIINIDGSPTVSNCMFTGNSAYYGGGMYNRDLSFPEVINCTFISNLANYGGGGIHNSSCSPRITNCIFVFNSSNEGGAMRNWYSSPQVTNCTFNGNLATGDWGRGGGMHNFYSSPQVINCTFWNNTADYSGGGMSNLFDCNPTVTNCIFWGNSDSGGTVEPAQIHNSNSTPVVNYCCVQGWIGGMGGTGNIGDDPVFKDADGPDDVAGTEDDNLQLAYDSPCIDAGNSNSVPPDYADLDEDGDTAEQTPLDLAHHARFTDDPLTDDTGTGTPPIVDMGAYERYELCGSEAYPHRPGDANQDCRFDLADIAIIARQWLDYYGPV